MAIHQQFKATLFAICIELCVHPRVVDRSYAWLPILLDQYFAAATTFCTTENF